MRSVLLLGLPVALLFAVGCDLLIPKVSQEKMEAALTEWLATHDLEATDIHCPDNQKLEKGNVFQCTCKVHGIDVPVKVEVTDVSTGTVEWKPVYLTMKGEEFAKEIKANPTFSKDKIEVTCEDKVLVSVPDSEWKCEIVDKGSNDKTYAATVKFTDDKGGHDINWVEK